MPWYRCLLIFEEKIKVSHPPPSATWGYIISYFVVSAFDSLYWRSDQQTLAMSYHIRQNCSPFCIWEGPCTLVCSSTSFNHQKFTLFLCIWQVLIKLYLKQDIVATWFLYNCLLNLSFLSSFGPEEFFQGEIFHKLPEAPSILEGARVCQVFEVSMQAPIVNEITSKYAVGALFGCYWICTTIQYLDDKCCMRQLMTQHGLWFWWWEKLSLLVD